MNFEQEARGDVTILRPLGRLDYISFAGLRVILMAGKRLRAPGGKLVLCGLGEHVRGVFEMSGFLNLFAVVYQLDGALTLV